MDPGEIDTAAADGKKAGSAALVALAIGTFGIGTTEFGPMGFLPDFAASLKISIPEAGQIVSVYALGVMLSAPLMTLALACLRIRDALMLLMSIFVVGNVLSALAPSFAIILGARLVTSFAHGAFIGLGSIVAADAVSRDKRASAIATMFMGITVANIGGVPAASWISEQLGWRPAFFAIAMFGVVAIAMLWWALPTGAIGKTANVRGELRALASPAVFITIASSAVGSAAMFAFYTYIAALLNHITGASKNFVSICLIITGIGFTIGNAFGGRLADWSRSGAAQIVLASLAIVLAALPLLLTTHVGALVGLLLFGIFSFAMVPPMQSQVMRAAAEAPSLASSVNAGAFNLGNALGAMAGGTVIGLGFGYGAVPLVGSVMALMSLLLVFLGWPSERASVTRDGEPLDRES